MDSKQLKKLCRDLKYMTDGNHHTGALIAIWRAFPELGLIYQGSLFGIQLAAEIAGQMPPWMMDARNTCYQSMMARLQQIDPVAHAAIYECL